MKKLLTIIKREYLTRVNSKAFIFSTILGPILMVAFMVVPVLIARIEAGAATRLAIVDQTDRIFDRVRDAIINEGGEESETSLPGGLSVDISQSPEERARQAGKGLKGDFKIEKVEPAGRILEDLKLELNQRVRRKELDGYIVIPADLLSGRKAEYYGHNVGDFINSMRIEEGLSRAVNDQRLADTGVDQNLLRELSRRVTVNTFKISEQTQEQDSGQAFFLVLGVGFLIFIMILMYGGTVLSAVMEEKETRIAEILFSSVRPFPLMLGKLVGVSLVALTQFAIWGLLIGGFSVYGVATLKGQGMALQLPPVSAADVVIFVLFFLLGFFMYASVYAVIGSIVRTYDESQGFLLVAIVPLILSFYLVFPVIRSPESTMAFWASIFPLSSPVIMPVRIVSQSVPFWQIGVSLLIGFGTAILLTWMAARIYRVGMLMYGKRATIPEIWRWVRQA
ncbi:MAG: ABC transporter permease [Pyrinomonadaceae bacterium]|jgi:ABC-2 type transport system permease protein|nr:ABC transporter permease [Pyrinomonadaceae bacterium]